MTIIYKQVLEVGKQSIELPIGSSILYVAEQGGSPCLWYGFDEKEGGKERVEIQVVETGQTFESQAYLGSCQCGPFVWHVQADFQRDSSIIIPAFMHQNWS